MPSASPGHENWVIFCAVIDNFGDIGVCWRLAVSNAAVVIEAFGCHLPEEVMTSLATMDAKGAPALCIKLEYVSAEPWVEDYHGQ